MTISYHFHANTHLTSASSSTLYSLTNYSDYKQNKMHFHSIIVLFVFLIIAIIVQSRVYVDTELGRIKGITKLSRNGSRFEAYIGIPYAKPPINELRFQVCKLFFFFNF